PAAGLSDVDPILIGDLQRTSTEVDPSSEKKTRLRSPGSAFATASARSAAGWWVKPANITCSKLAACAASAALSFGCACPCVQVHQEETRSRISLPSASNSEAPLAPASTIGSVSPACWV